MIFTEPTQALWDEQTLRNPHEVADKRGRVQRMFTAIAPSYDLCNRVHSFGMDVLWRRKAVKLSGLKPGETVVDVACGTGDLSLEFAGKLAGAQANAVSTGEVIGIDFTYAMLPLARKKGEAFSASRHKKGDAPPLSWVNGDAQALSLPDNSADVVSIAFGIRNVAEPGVAIGEFYRVLRPGGRLVILEFSLPTQPVVRGLYNFYFRQVLPRSATLISGDKTGAYRYLPESVNSFIDRNQMAQLMRDAGFSNVEQHPLTFGVSVCYVGRKQ